MANKFFASIKARYFGTAADNAVDIGVDADTDARLAIDAGGRVTWGSGSAAGDTNLYRDSANLLKTDDSFAALDVFTNKVAFNTAAEETLTTAGELAWDADRETVALRLDSQLSTYLNEDVLYHVVNDTGSPISKGTVVGSDGPVGVSGKIKIKPFLADGTDPSQFLMGVAAETIGDGEEGFVLHFGVLRGIDTDIYEDGDLLYASDSSAGAFTLTPPVAPKNNVLVALVLAAANNGVIFVRPTYASNLANDEKVDLTGLADDDILRYDSTSGVFVPAPVPVESVDSLTGDVVLTTRYAAASDTAPASPFTGQRWVDTTTGRLAYWTSSEWVETGTVGLYPFIVGNIDGGASDTIYGGMFTLSGGSA